MRAVVGSLLAVSGLVGIIGCAGSGVQQASLNQADVYGTPASGLVDGDASVAQFSNPANVEVGPDGTVYVADYDNYAVRAIAPNGTVSTLVKQSNFAQPFGLTLSPDGFLYVSTDFNDLGGKDATTGTIWQVDLKAKTCVVVAHNLGRPRGIAAISKTKIAMTDLLHNVVSILDTQTKAVTVLAGTLDQASHVNDVGAVARFSRPYGLAVMSDGSLLVADANNNCIRKVTMSGKVTDFAGSTTPGLQNGSALTAQFLNPQDIAISGGNVYVADTANHVVRRISGGNVTTFAGDGTQGFNVSPGLAAEFYGLEGLAMRPGSGTLWIADGNQGDGSDHNHVRKIPAQ